MYVERVDYKVFSQSERNLDLFGFYNETTKTTSLAHKKIAILAGSMVQTNT